MLVTVKITFVLPNVQISGGIKATLAMADALEDLGHDITVTYPIVPARDGLSWMNLRKTAVQLVRACQNIRVPRWIERPRNITRIPWAANRFLPYADVLVLTWWHDVRRFADSPADCGVQVHFVRSLETWGGPKAQVLESYRKTMPRVVTSIVLEAQVEAAGGKVDAKIPDGLEQVFLGLPMPEREEHQIPRIGILYRLQDWKRMDDAFEAIKWIRTNREIHLTVFGQRMRGRHKAIFELLPHRNFCHMPVGEEICNLYRSLDIFLYSSDETEAFGLPPFEALACGAALVCTRVGAVPEILQHNMDALLTEPGRPEELAQGALTLIDDPAHRRQLAAHGQQTVQRLNWPASAKLFEDYLHTLI